MKILGLILIGLGISSIGGGELNMPVGEGRRSMFLQEYKKAKLENREPTPDQKFAYSNYVFIKAGFILVISGIVIWLVGFLSGEE